MSLVQVPRYAPRAIVRNFARYAANYGRNRLANYLSSRRGVRQRMFSRNRTMTRKKRTSVGRGVTDNYDRRTIYRKRQMPRWRKRSWKRFKSRVHAVGEKDLGTRTVLFNKTETFSLTGIQAGKQLTGDLPLYSIKSGLGAPFSDIRTIMDTENIIPNTGKLLFQSGIFDMTVVNTSHEDNGAGEPGNGIDVEVDVYYMTANTEFEKVGGTSKTMLAALADGASETPNLGTAITGITMESRGATPWDIPQALSAFKIKIWKKTKYTLGPGKSFTYQMRDPRRHVLDKATINDYTGTNKPGLTKWVVLIAKPIPGFVDGNGANTRLECGVTRKYSYKVDSTSDDADAVLS